MGRMLLVIVDACSKWVDIHSLTSTTSRETTDALRTSIAIHGIPDTLVSDNGSCVSPLGSFSYSANQIALCI